MLYIFSYVSLRCKCIEIFQPYLDRGVGGGGGGGGDSARGNFELE